MTRTASDLLEVYGRKLNNRLWLGTAQYPSPDVLARAIRSAGIDMVTVSLRREAARGATGNDFWQLIRDVGVAVLPNTAGCKTAREAITTAQMAREVFETPWIKLEVIANDDTLQPEVFGLVEAATELTREGFSVFPYTTDDLGVAERLLTAGCEVLMPWGSPIGSGRGLNNPYALRTMRAYFPGIPLVVDAGIGAPSHATAAMEMGYDAVLLNTAVAKAADPIAMANAFSSAVAVGRVAYSAGLMETRDMASPSTPVVGTPSFTFGDP